LSQVKENEGQATRNDRTSNRNKRLDLVNAYRLLINAYIRSSDPTKQEKTERKPNRS